MTFRAAVLSERFDALSPRGANARLSADCGAVPPPLGGPPQMPRRGVLHATAPVQRWRIA